MKILALEKEVTGVADEIFSDELLAEEARHAWELHSAGVIRELYFRSDKSVAVLVLECANVDEAKDVLATLPLVRDGLIDFEIIPLVSYPGFARLFQVPKG